MKLQWEASLTHNAPDQLCSALCGETVPTLPGLGQHEVWVHSQGAAKAGYFAQIHIWVLPVLNSFALCTSLSAAKRAWVSWCSYGFVICLNNTFPPCVFLDFFFKFHPVFLILSGSRATVPITQVKWTFIAVSCAPKGHNESRSKKPGNPVKHTLRKDFNGRAIYERVLVFVWDIQQNSFVLVKPLSFKDLRVLNMNFKSLDSPLCRKGNWRHSGVKWFTRSHSLGPWKSSS